VVMAVCHLVSAATAALIPRLRGAGGSAASAAMAAGSSGSASSATQASDVGASAASASASPASTSPTPEVGASAGPALAPNAFREIREGFAWLFSRPDLRGVLLILTIINLGINTVMTTIVYALQQDGQSPAVIGWISAGLGVTTLAGALLATPLVSRVGTGM